MPYREGSTSMPGKIVFRGKEYKTLGDMPPELRAAYEQAAGLSDASGPSLAELEATQRSLGPIQHLDLTSRDMVDAYHDLGAEVGRQVEVILESKIASLDRAQLAQEVRHARQSQSAIFRRLGSRRIHGRVRWALREYLRCLSAWADGAQLGAFSGRALRDFRVDGLPVSGDDLAFLLQNESTGCQTGVFREDDHSVILWHTEEDRTTLSHNRFDKLRLASFKGTENGRSRVITAFVYPDLLPGSAFGWSDNSYVQAVDAFYLRPSGDPPGVPANAVAWICLLLAGEIPSAEIAEALAPFYGGYAITSVSRTESSLCTGTTEFVASTVVSTPLPDAPGSARLQVNLLSDQASRAASENEDIHPDLRRAQERRIARTRRALGVIARSPDRLAGFSSLLASRVGGGFAYCNKDVKAHFLCRMTMDGASMWVGAGPAVRPDGLLASAWT